MTNNFRPNWGPTYSPEYVPIMLTLAGLCALGFLSSIFPIIEIVITCLVIACALVFLVRVAIHIRRERKLDWEAQYGPLTEEEKEQINVKRRTH